MSNSTTHLCVWAPELIQQAKGGDLDYARPSEYNHRDMAIAEITAIANAEGWPVQTRTTPGRTELRNAADGMPMATIYEIQGK